MSEKKTKKPMFTQHNRGTGRGVQIFSASEAHNFVQHGDGIQIIDGVVHERREQSEDTIHVGSGQVKFQQFNHARDGVSHGQQRMVVEDSGIGFQAVNMTTHFK